MIDKIEFLIGEAATALRRNGLMSFAAITTIAVSLFLLGGLGYSYYNLSEYAKTIEGGFEMQVYLRDDVTARSIPQVIKQLREIDGVKQVQWIPRDKAWEKKKAEDPESFIGLDNPLPESFKVVLSDLNKADAVERTIYALPEVSQDGVLYLRAEQQFIQNMLEFVRWLGPVLGGLLFLTGGILIYNAIRLTTLSRRLEIRIMQLVGASRLTVQLPFVFEGIVLGFIGGTIASLLLAGAYALAELKFTEIQTGTTWHPFPMLWCFALLASAGAIYGTLCSSMAMRAPLKYR